VIRISESVRNNHCQDGGIVLDIRHGRMYGLNFVGSRILELVKQDYQETQIAEEISRQFGVSLDTAIADVREFLGLLEAHRLIERRDMRLDP
jgi:Coenzyme PQQ synthesis protein D (PqqD)